MQALTDSRNPKMESTRKHQPCPGRPGRGSGRCQESGSDGGGSGFPSGEYRRSQLRLVALDGQALMLRGEARNREEFGLPGAWRGASAFPQARAAAVTEIGTGAGLAWHAGPCAESEADEAERLPGHPSSGMPVPADRHHADPPPWSRAAATGAGLLWRCKGNMLLIHLQY